MASETTGETTGDTKKECEESAWSYWWLIFPFWFVIGEDLVAALSFDAAAARIAAFHNTILEATFIAPTARWLAASLDVTVGNAYVILLAAAIVNVGALMFAMRASRRA